MTPGTLGGGGACGEGGTVGVVTAGVVTVGVVTIGVVTGGTVTGGTVTVGSVTVGSVIGGGGSPGSAEADADQPAVSGTIIRAPWTARRRKRDLNRYTCMHQMP